MIVPLPSAEAGAADDDRGEHREGLRQADVGLRGLDEREIEDPGDRGKDGAQNEGEDLVALHRQPREPGRLRVAADRHQAEAEQRAVQQEDRPTTASPSIQNDLGGELMRAEAAGSGR